MTRLPPKPLSRFRVRFRGWNRVRSFTGVLVVILGGLGGASFSGSARAEANSSLPTPDRTRDVDPTSHFAIEVWATEAGLPHTHVTALLQTRAGYIWAGTYNGIAQFDGVRFVIFDSSNTEGLPNSRITSLFEDARGDIWIGHDTGEITRFSAGVFHSVPFPAGWSRGTISGIGADHAGDVWTVKHSGEALRIRDGLLLNPSPEMAAVPMVMPQLVAGPRHRLFVARNGIVGEIVASGYRPVDFQSGTPPPYYDRIAAARRGGWWVAGGGRVRRWSDGTWQEDLGPFPWGQAFVTTLMESTAEQLLVGTLERGMFIFDRDDGWMSLNRSNGLPQDWVRCLAEDREHNIWVGTSGGLVILRPRRVVMYSPPDGWQGRSVMGIARGHDGAVWAATEGAGLYRLKDNAWTHFGANEGLSNRFVWAVMEDSRGGVWAGTWGGGLFRLEGDRFVQQFDLEERGEPVTALLETPKDTIWIGTALGLIRCADSKLVRMAAQGGAVAGNVRALAAGRQGTIWVGTQGSGLGRIEDGEVLTFTRAAGLPRDFILSLYEEPDGTLWIGTLDRGLCRFRNGRFDSITTDQGLPNNVIDHIEDDQLGSLWFNSQRGLFCVSKRELNDCADGRKSVLQPLVFGKAEGMTTAAGSGGFTPSGFRAPDGRLWFPTASGIAVVNPRSVGASEVAPSVWIEEVFVEGQRVQFQTNSALNDRSRHLDVTTAARRSLELRPGQHRLEALFTGISFTSPNRVHFKYRLEGLDADWSDVGTLRRVTYPYLPPGRYRFRVTACNSEGLWNDVGDTLDIVVLPHLWQRTWFQVGLVFVGFIVVGGGVQVAARRRHRLKLERIGREHALERERARIAQDIHDDLGASLTRIGMLSQSATGELQDPPRVSAHLGQIYDIAREVTRAMDEIVWAVNPRHDTLESLANYLSRFAHDFLSAARIRCRLDTPVELPELPIRSEVRHNLFLAFKETLNNAVKHSGATEIRISLEMLPGFLKLSAADNGSGFDLNTTHTAPSDDRLVSGYGMAGIQERLKQIGGRVELHSRPGKGTRVELFVPLPEGSRPGALAHKHK